MLARHPRESEAIRYAARERYLRAAGMASPATLPELQLRAIDDRRRWRDEAPCVPLMAALEELNTYAGIVLAQHGGTDR